MRASGAIALFAALALLAPGVTGCTYTQIAPADPSADPYYDDYYEPDYVPEVARGAFGQLSMWGYWVEVPEFGWVWQPDVFYDWQPYYHGHWVWTAYDWTWVSYEPFGWITYHYGYWHYHPQYGWLWIPDYYWYPSGVTWIHYDNYVCWAPMPPPGHHLLDPWHMHEDYVWMIVDVDHFLSPAVGNYKHRSLRADPRYGSKKVFRKAPDKIFVERKTRQRIREVDIDVREVRKGDHNYKRVAFPDQRKTIERHRPQAGRKSNKRIGAPTYPPKNTSGKEHRTRDVKSKSEPRSDGSTREARPSKTKKKKKKD